MRDDDGLPQVPKRTRKDYPARVGGNNSIAGASLELYAAADKERAALGIAVFARAGL